MTEEVYNADSGPIVTTEWLSECLGEPGIVPVDVRPPYFFAQAHLPGAVNLPAFYLQGQNGRPPRAEELARRLGDLGLTRDSHIVAYDEGGSPAAAVLYWTLRYFRHPRVSVLDGGITKWRREGRDWEYTGQMPEPANYEIQAPDPGVLATRADVVAALDDSGAVLVDVRSPAEFLGLQPAAIRNGHLRGAINFEWSNALQIGADDLPVTRTPEELRALLLEAGVTPDKEVIVYCQSGSRSSHTFLVLDVLGYTTTKNYLAGWQEWGNREDTPVEAE
jgi:thiosulfate/3-mercaptopyruvate sulfurtransferase